MTDENIYESVNDGDLIQCWIFNPDTNWTSNPKIRLIGLVIEKTDKRTKLGARIIYVLTDLGVIATPKIKIERIINRIN